MNEQEAFKLCTGPGRQGFWITFANGYKVSVQFAPAPLNYCDGGKTTAEVAVVEPDGRSFVRLTENDDVLSRVSPERVAELIYEYSMKETKTQVFLDLVNDDIEPDTAAEIAGLEKEDA